MELTFNFMGKCNLEAWIRDIKLKGSFLVRLPNQQCIYSLKKPLAQTLRDLHYMVFFLSIHVIV